MVSDMVNQIKIFSFKIKCQAKNVFQSDVKRTVAQIFGYVCSALDKGSVQRIFYPLLFRSMLKCPFAMLNS